MRTPADILRYALPSLDRRHVRLIVGDVLKISPDRIYESLDTTLSPAQIAEIDQKFARLASGEPVTRILGRREFWKHTFVLGQETLDPRPESEHLIEEALSFYQKNPVPVPRILDLGTGSGCLLLSLLAEIPDATGVGVDISHGALVVARENARRLGLSPRSAFIQGNWCAALAGSFDIIISNPPYISATEFTTLDANVRDYDPYAALVSGEDGLECYRMIRDNLPFVAKKGSFVAMEIGFRQKISVKNIFFDILTAVACVKDFSSKERIIKGIYA